MTIAHNQSFVYFITSWKCMVSYSEPSHQYQQSCLNIHCIWPVPYRNYKVIWKILQNKSTFWKLITQLFGCEIGHNFSTLKWHFKSKCKEYEELFILHGQYHGCWYPGDAMSQGISNHGIDLVLEWSGLSTRRINYIPHVSRHQSVIESSPCLLMALLPWVTWLPRKKGCNQSWIFMK